MLTIQFTVAGIPCIGLNGGPVLKPDEAFSFQIATDDQEETAHYWHAIVGTGSSKSESAGARSAGACPGRSRRAH